MRIATANNFYYLRGGSERVFLDEERCLVARGNTVAPFSTVRLDNRVAETHSFFVPARQIDKRSGWDRIFGLPSVIHNSGAARNFGKLLDMFHPDIVHAHNIYGTLTTAVLVAARRRGIPAVMTAHDTKLVCASYLSLNHGRTCEACAGRYFYHCALSRCHSRGAMASYIYTFEAYFNLWLRRYESLKCVITPSQFLKALIERFGAASRVEVIPNGVDVDRITPSFISGEYVLYAGRLSTEKGVLTLIKAARAARIPLRIVGDGPKRTDAEAAAEGCDHIWFDGYRRGAELRSLFEHAALVVLPSECYENAPMAILEAYAYGKPVLGADIGGIPELIRKGVTGELFKSGDMDDLQKELHQLWSRRNALVDMGRSARSVAEKEYSLDLHCGRLEQLYRSILS